MLARQPQQPCRLFGHGPYVIQYLFLTALLPLQGAIRAGWFQLVASKCSAVTADAAGWSPLVSAIFFKQLKARSNPTSGNIRGRSAKSVRPRFFRHLRSLNGSWFREKSGLGHHCLEQLSCADRFVFDLGVRRHFGWHDSRPWKKAQGRSYPDCDPQGRAPETWNPS